MMILSIDDGARLSVQHDTPMSAQTYSLQGHFKEGANTLDCVSSKRLNPEDRRVEYTMT